ncbi:uncharacterized protein LOC133642088 [Entelurus aequoreus]|uniref:uncharacterized protein LOC133642088 n=1 Tax=Entelurus aequoreus TaxID=161455 RepID=UPI002B1CE3C6|nr:uncharacterized protein LOC133642088 [Entelurus aequoreus]
MRVDLGKQLQFPREIVETLLRPDLVFWSEVCKTVLLVELTVPWEGGLEAAYERERAKYSDLAAECREAGWKAVICPLEVRCRGFVGSSTARLLRDIVCTGAGHRKTMKELAEEVDKGSFWLWLRRKQKKRFRFHKRNQEEGESVSQFIAVLKRLSEHCEFGLSLNDTIRDRLVCGLRSEAIQKRLLTEADLTLEKTKPVTIASGEDTSTKCCTLRGLMMTHASRHLLFRSCVLPWSSLKPQTRLLFEVHLDLLLAHRNLHEYLPQVSLHPDQNPHHLQ